MKKEVKLRVISAVVVAPFVVACFVTYKSLVGLVAAVIVLSSFELFSFSLKDRRKAYIAYLTALVSIFPVLYGLFFFDYPHLVLFVLFAVGSVSIMIKEKDPIKANEDYYSFSIALLYISLGLSFFLPLYKEYSGGIALLALTGVWAFDSFAYFTGLKFGRVRIFKEYTKKTLEGVIGGFFGVFIYSLIFNWVLTLLGKNHLTIPESLAFAVGVSVMDTFGDVFESSIKRKFGVKDSGVVMPGHGGMLDRIDGLLFSTPIFYLILKLLRR